jgi:3-deoxy-D-manno-octulosonate 8-phosphate phosphatase (KDO 8-P phosphatase)
VIRDFAPPMTKRRSNSPNERRHLTTRLNNAAAQQQTQQQTQQQVQQVKSEAEIRQIASNISLAAFDVDGVMTDGKLYFSAQGDELKAFNILDGLGLKLLQNSGVEIAFITGRTSPLTEKRAKDLGIKHLIQGREDKKVALQTLADSLNTPMQQVAYVGDDLPDLGAIRMAGLGITVANACDFVKIHADWCTNLGGGEGAVREICDMILDAKGLKQQLLASFL